MRVIIELSQNKKAISYCDLYKFLGNLMVEIGKTRNSVRKAIINDTPDFSGSHPIPYIGMVKNGLIYTGKYRLYISSNFDNIINDIIDYLGSNNVRIGPLTVRSFRLDDNISTFNISNMISRSPVIIKHNEEYIDAENINFLTEVKKDIIKKYRDINGLEPEIDLIKIIHFRTVNLKIDNKMEKASMIKFTVMADNRVINNILNTGIGELTKYGFGYIDEEKVPSDFGIMY